MHDEDGRNWMYVFAAINFATWMLFAFWLRNYPVAAYLAVSASLIGTLVLLKMADVIDEEEK